MLEGTVLNRVTAEVYVFECIDAHVAGYAFDLVFDCDEFFEAFGKQANVS